MATAGLRVQEEAGRSPWGPANGMPVYGENGQLAGWRAPDTVNGGTPVVGGAATPAAPGAAPGAGAVPASMRALASAAGYSSSGGSGQTDLEAERLRVAGQNAGIANREDTQAHDLELARLSGQQGLDAMQKGADLKTSQQSSADANLKAQQDRMLGLITPFLNQTSHVTPPNEADVTGAQDAAFARAKDRTAQIARSSLMALRNVSAERGVNVAGGNNPALMATEGRLMSDAAQPLADLTREQAIQTTQRAQSVADRNYAGALQEQGQRNSLVPSLLSLVRMSGAVY